MERGLRKKINQIATGNAMSAMIQNARLISFVRATT